MDETSRFPGYDVLSKRDSPSWDDTTRAVIDRRMQTPRTPRFMSAAEWRTADALCRRIVPDIGVDAVPLVAMLDTKLLNDHGGGFREADMPYMREAWQAGLRGLDGNARALPIGLAFASLAPAQQDELLEAMQHGRLDAAPWSGMDPKTFFHRRVLVDVPPLYYGQPAAWSELGFGGPASPRGYVRLDGDRLDPWEAAEATPGRVQEALRANGHVG